jgi:tripartite-type tricarboxylate transporter receptor subunit TctC
MHKRHFIRTGLALAAGLALTSLAHAQQWKPTKPINLIVPWAAGGSTDQVTRVTAAELEKVLDQKIVIVNQPGASGSIGTKSVWEAPRDGYTWAAGAAQDLGVYQALGMLDVPAKDWHLFLSVANVPVVGANAGGPYQSMAQLLEAMKAKPGTVKVSTGGVASSSFNAIELITKSAGVTYRHVPYDGGNPAVISTVAGETDVTTQLAVEQADHIRAKRIRPLAAVSDKALELEGFGTIEPVTKTLPNLKVATNYFGIFIPKGVPPEVVATITKIWNENIKSSEALKKYAVSRGALFQPVGGDDAQKAAAPAIAANAWLMHDSGKTKVSPETLGIAKP